MQNDVDAPGWRGGRVGESAAVPDGPGILQDGGDCNHLGRVGPSVQVGKQDARSDPGRDTGRHCASLQRPLPGVVRLQMGRVDIQPAATDIYLYA